MTSVFSVLPSFAHMCVWCAYAYVCFYVFLCVCASCVSVVSCMDICIGLRLMSSIILNSFTVFFELGSLSQTLGSQIYLILLASLL